MHERGLKFGLHHLSFLIDKIDPLVTPRPDSRLAKENPVILAESVDATEMFLAVDPDTPADLIQVYKGYFAAGERDIVIDDEIMVCNGFRDGDSQTPPGFVVARRGYAGTTGQTHAADALIYHLPQLFNSYLADMRSDLPDEIAARLAEVYQAVEGDFIYLDGAGAIHRLFPKTPPEFIMGSGRNFAGLFTIEKFLGKLNRDVFLQTSATPANSNYTWHFIARGSGSDYVTIGVEAHLDYNRIGARHDRRFHLSAMPMELGWFALLARKAESNRTLYHNSYPSTSLDEIEYIMNRALAFDMPISLETNEGELQANGHTKKIFQRIGDYEKLRLSGYFPASFTRTMQRPDEEFIQTYGLLKEQYRLVRGRRVRYGFKRQAYLERVLSSGEEWTFENPFHSQTLKVKITALPSHETVSHEHNQELLSLSDLKADSALSQVTYAHENGLLKAEYLPSRPEVSHEFGWCVFSQPLEADLSQHKYLYIDFEGEGKGEVLTIQLTDRRGNHRIFDMVMENGVSGRRQTVFYQPATSGFYKYPPLFGGVLNFRYFDYASIRKLTLYVKNIPQIEGGVQIRLHSIKALKQDLEAILREPKISLNNRDLLFPLSLNPRSDELNAEPWEYAEFNRRRIQKYDGNHQLLSGYRLPYRTKTPVVRRGANTLRYTHMGENKGLVRLCLEDVSIYPVS